MLWKIVEYFELLYYWFKFFYSELIEAIIKQH
jgi:hypothetical protein